ncbi:thioredoxin-disulfide reductase [bacterium]|nr:thioredoxin-disulfide reductase [bacterium]
MDKTFDTIILGGGPAGMSAAIYSARGLCETAIVDTCTLGGQPSNYMEIDNYPGMMKLGGFDLAEKFEKHMDMYKVSKFLMQEIEYIDLRSEIKVVKTKEHTLSAKTLIIATGARPIHLNVEGEEKFAGRGVSYCAVCDGGFFKDKVAAVVGGGNSALEEAMYLTKFAKKIYLIHRRDEFRADKVIQERLKSNDKIEVIYNSTVEKIQGDEVVKSIILKNVKTGENSLLEVDGVFPYIGIHPNSELFSGQLEQDAKGFIMTDNTMNTSVPGVFAVGDVRNTPLRQVITAVSDGAVAAVYAGKYMEAAVVKQNV